MIPNSPFFTLLLFLFLPWTLLADFGDTFATATPLAFNTMVSDDLPSGDVDIFVLKLIVGRSYRVTIESTAPIIQKSLYIYDSNLASVTGGTGTTGSLSYTPTLTQNFYVRIAAATAGQYGVYNFAVVDASSCPATCSSHIFLGIINNLFVDCEAKTSICPICVTGYQCNSCVNVPADFPYTYGGSCYCFSGQYYSSETCIGKVLLLERSFEFNISMYGVG